MGSLKLLKQLLLAVVTVPAGGLGATANGRNSWMRPVAVAVALLATPPRYISSERAVRLRLRPPMP